MEKIELRKIENNDGSFICRACQRQLKRVYFLCSACHKVTCKTCFHEIKSTRICKNCSGEIARAKLVRIQYLCESLSHLEKYVAVSFKEVLSSGVV